MWGPIVLAMMLPTFHAHASVLRIFGQRVMAVAYPCFGVGIPVDLVNSRGGRRGLSTHWPMI